MLGWTASVRFTSTETRDSVVNLPAASPSRPVRSRSLCARWSVYQRHVRWESAFWCACSQSRRRECRVPHRSRLMVSIPTQWSSPRCTLGQDLVVAFRHSQAVLAIRGGGHQRRGGGDSQIGGLVDSAWTDGLPIKTSCGEVNAWQNQRNRDVTIGGFDSASTVTLPINTKTLNH